MDEPTSDVAERRVGHSHHSPGLDVYTRDTPREPVDYSYPLFYTECRHITEGFLVWNEGPGLPERTTSKRYIVPTETFEVAVGSSVDTVRKTP